MPLGQWTMAALRVPDDYRNAGLVPRMIEFYEYMKAHAPQDVTVCFGLGTEGVFGVALGVSTGMVFMFVLFGAMLEAAGAGNYFIRKKSKR